MLPLKLQLIILTILVYTCAICQNSMVGDGFGGRKWYTPTNYTVGSYSGYSVCYEGCEGSDNQLYGWGSNYTNQIGLGLNVGGANTPNPIPNMTNVTYYSTGYNMGAIKKDGSGWIWGSFANGPIQVLTDAYFLDASSYNISFVKTDGTVWSFGDNFSGQMGNGNNNNPANFITPVIMNNITNAVRVANNYYATIILLADSTLMATGNNTTGSLGLGQSINAVNIPTPINGLSKIIDIKSNAIGTIALTSDGDVYYWGENFQTSNFIYVPTLIPQLSNIVAISGCDDGYHFMALDETKNCYAWGYNYGQMGLSTNTDTPQIAATDVIDIMAGETFSYVVKSDGSLWATGWSVTSGSSIWLNLVDTPRVQFTKLNPSQVPGACRIVGGGLPCDVIEAVTDSIFFPNIFSPNGDNHNDALYFPNSGIEELNCMVFNRWGNKVFEWYDVNGSWDGNTTAGQPSSDGTYYYIVKYRKEFSDEWQIHKGFVLLIR